MNWNPVQAKFKEIKSAYIERFGEEALWEYPESSSCLEYWVTQLDNPAYTELLAPLIFHEYEGMLLIRYGNFHQLFKPISQSLSYPDFWQVHNEFYKECRSLVLDIHTGELILTPFRKFQNLNECEANSEARIRQLIQSANRVEFTNKLDGSMQSARWFHNHLVMSGSQSLDPASSYRLAGGMHYLQSHPNYLQFLQAYSDYTAIFEYISLNDKHIVQYTEEQQGLYLVGMRSISTGEELSYSLLTTIAASYNLLTTTLYTTTLDEVLQALDSKQCSEAEGFVLDIDGYKVKIKYNDYVGMHKILATLTSANTIIQAIDQGTWDDLYAKLPAAYQPEALAKATLVFQYIQAKQSITHSYIMQLSSARTNPDRKSDMQWIDQHVPKAYRGYVRNEYLGKENNYIKTRAGRYLKLHEIESFLNTLSDQPSPVQGVSRPC
jgi:hypothetical protein